MQPILKADEQQPTSTQTNGYVKQVNGTPKSKPNQEKIVLPVEMASMISLKSLIGKLVHKSYADLLTLTDTYGEKKITLENTVLIMALVYHPCLMWKRNDKY